MLKHKVTRLIVVAIMTLSSASLSRAAALDKADVVRFLEQSTWGPNDTAISEVEALGSLQAFLQQQFKAAPSLYPLTPASPNDSNSLCPKGSPASCYRDHYTQYPNQVVFFKHGLQADDQLRQRVAFALSEILVVSGVKINQPGFMARYLNLLQHDAFGNYRQILSDITLSPAMGHYLDMVNNNKPRADGSLRSNENYAREVLQLFSVGLYWLNVDGSLSLDNQGQAVATYDQSVVEGFSHVFTGWTYADPGKSVASKFWNTQNFSNPMVLYRDGKGADIHHDKTAKKLLSHTPGGQSVNLQANQDGVADLDQALDNIFHHPNVGVFIGKQLIQHLVASNPSPAYVQRVATAFNQGRSNGFGSGQRGDMQALIAAILLDQEARGSVKTDAGYGHLREPVQFVLNILRAVNASSDGELESQVNAMGQDLFNSPTVFNYYPHSYIVSSTTLQGPEFGIDSSANALHRENFVNTLVFSQFKSSDSTGTKMDFSALKALAANPNNLVDTLNSLFLHGSMSSSLKNTILESIANIPTTNLLLRSQTALYLILASGQYQVQR